MEDQSLCRQDLEYLGTNYFGITGLHSKKVRFCIESYEMTRLGALVVGEGIVDSWQQECVLAAAGGHGAWPCCDTT